MKTPPKHFPTFPVSEKHYAAIGKVASNWSALERLMDSLIWRLALVMDHEGACITAQIANTARRLDAIISLIRLAGGSDGLIRQYNKFAEATYGLQERRNRTAHDPWVMELPTGVPHRLEVSASKSVVFDYKPVPTADVLALVEAINTHVERFSNLADQTKAELDASRRTRLESYLAMLTKDPT